MTLEDPLAFKGPDALLQEVQDIEVGNAGEEQEIEKRESSPEMDSRVIDPETQIQEADIYYPSQIIEIG